MKTITYIGAEHLFPHPQNPRKDLGDLSELTESIRINGVLQNLTVVPFVMDDGTVSDDDYTIIIGHRRHAAAVAAGVSALPCVITNMSMEDQLSTMLVENVQRSDLTPYEQAKGFQLMLDMGKTVNQVAKMSGFSETTIRHRVKMAQLDDKAFKKASDRGATLFDFAKLEKVEDPEEKAKLLGIIGTPSFQNAYEKVITKQEQMHKLETVGNEIRAVAQKVVAKEGKYYLCSDESAGPMELKHLKSIGYWNTKDWEKPTDADTVRYYYTHNDDEPLASYVFYREPKPEDFVESEEEKQRKAICLKQSAREAALQEITDRHRLLRVNFVMSIRRTKALSEKVMAAFSEYLMSMRGNPYGYGLVVNPDIVSALIGVKPDAQGVYDGPDLRQQISDDPGYALLVTMYGMLEKRNGMAYYRNDWSSEYRCYIPRYSDNEDLDALYDFLEGIGYEASDEEYEMRNGTHELFDDGLS